MQFMKISARVVLLLMVGVSIDVIWICCTMFLAPELAQRGVSMAPAQRCAGMLTVFAMVVAPAIPIQSLFPKHAVAAGFAVGWIPLAMDLLLALPRTEGVPSQFGMWLIVVNGTIAWMAVIFGAWAVSLIRKSEY